MLLNIKPTSRDMMLYHQAIQMGMKHTLLHRIDRIGERRWLEMGHESHLR